MDYPNIIRLDNRNKEHIKAISMLHQNLLPESKVAQLGQFFLNNFYYNNLVDDKLIDAFLYKVDKDYAGFIVCTDYPFEFMKIGIKKNLLKLIFTLLVALTENPLRVKILFEMISSNFPDSVRKELVNSGQFMSFGVLEEYRKIKNEKSGLTIPNILMKKVFEHFSEGNKPSFFLMVLQSNEHAIRFYKKYNGIILEDIIGESNIVKFEIEEKV